MYVGSKCEYAVREGPESRLLHGAVSLARGTEHGAGGRRTVMALEGTLERVAVAPWRGSICSYPESGMVASGHQTQTVHYNCTQSVRQG